ncbi:ATP-dependent RNA helicase RhlE [Nitrosospira sp. Nl5]|uniref:DEAD/DEAH box helicase n=1 Tax=Nitrosospira sp. Nl5 TaxID=200120 RepID=UPI0008825D31|nr:DEAD/DEAH box helicase [Nitrosospira sp. Nl5]SCY52301.1 ATP-dependent RNA helicase RhlE [Nitrosospira sp. Nl5]
MSFDQLNLSAEILHAIADQGYTEPTPIQAQAIPPILEGKDIMGGAQTGTGKTAGFTLPMLHRLQSHANTSVSPARHPIRALILVPTRELAAQVYESVKTYGKYLPLKCAVVYGGINMDPQVKELRAGVEILVATPGRLLDHIEQKTMSLSKVEILILDEADRMLDMGFMPDIKRILALIPQHRQSLMFSATFSDEIKRLADKLLKQPVLIEVARRNSITELVTHVVYPVERDRKRELLAHLIKSHDLQQVLVFVRTKHGASRLAQQLERDGITATAIHGDKSQPQRTQALAEFKQGVVRVLVATDVAARGLDIEDLPHVVNFELPTTPEDYIHRIGRTGRAGTKGDAISLVCEDENELLGGIEKLLKFKLNVRTIAGFEPEMRNRTADQESSRGRRNRDERAKPEQKKPSESRAAQFDETPQASQSQVKRPRQRGEHGRSQGGRKTPEDPLFSQPYTPSAPSSNNKSASSVNPATSSSAIERSHGHARPGQQKKPLAALFMPRSPRKPQQEE